MPHIMTMNSGEQSVIVTPANELSYLRCIKGCMRVFSHHCGVGWNFAEGEHFVLRTGARYSIAANEPIQVALHQLALHANDNFPASFAGSVGGRT